MDESAAEREDMSPVVQLTGSWKMPKAYRRAPERGANGNDLAKAHLKASQNDRASEQPEQFVALDRQFDLERAGPVVRIWCTTCNKHQVLADDGVRAVELARESHRCGPRTAEWDGGFSLRSGGSA